MIRRIALLSTLLISFADPASAGNGGPAHADSLFARLGGTARVEAFVNATLDLAQQGATLGGNREEIKADLVAHICAVTGGGCRHRLKDGRKAGHTALQAGGGLIEALRLAMRTHGVPLAARNELLEALVPAKDLARL